MQQQQDFTTRLLRFIASQLYVTVEMYAARELFGQSLFALSEQQRMEVNAKVDEFLSPAFERMTEANLTPPQEGGPSSTLIH